MSRCTTLPQTGIYTVRVDSPPQQTMSFNASIVQAVTASLTLNTPLSVSLPVAGQYEVLSFIATAGQSPTLQLSSVTTMPTGQASRGHSLQPWRIAGDETEQQAGIRYRSIWGSLTAGTYKVVVVPDYARPRQMHKCSCSRHTSKTSITLIPGTSEVCHE